MVLAPDAKRIPGARRALTLALLLAGTLALIASGAPASWAAPAQEEYRLQLPDARGGGSSSPGEARSALSQGSSASPSSSGGSSTDATPPGAGSSTGGASGPKNGSGGFGAGGDGGAFPGSGSSHEALLAKARDGVPGSGMLSASTSAAGKTPIGLAVIGALLLIALAGVLAAWRGRRAKGTATD